MTDKVASPDDGWQVQSGNTGVDVYYHQGLVAGPFETWDEAWAAALALKKKVDNTLPVLRDVESGSDADAIEDIVSPNIKRRQSRPEVVTAKRLREGLMPLHRRITKWQTRSIWIAARVAGKKPDAPGIREDAQQLIEQVADGKTALQELIESIPGVAASSKILDVRNALDRIEASMRQAIAQARCDGRGS